MHRIARVTYSSLLLLAVGIYGVPSLATADEWPKSVNISLQNLFVPAGFDDTDEVMVVLDGYLPTACHRLQEPEITKKPGRQIVVAPRATQFKGECPEIVVPFTQAVKLGRLRAGEYQVMSLDGRQLEKLSVARAEWPGVDDHFYAPVDRAHVLYPSPGRFAAVLEGRLTNTCLRLGETKVHLTGKTIQVLPVMNYATSGLGGEPCRAEESHFRIEVELPALKDEGRYLLHVRTLNGQAVNEVFTRKALQP